MTVELNTVPWDSDGFLKDTSSWNEELADILAAHDDIKLSAEHWDIIYLLREFYEDHQVVPANRALVNLVKHKLDTEKGKSLYLMKLFGGSPAKLASKISGLPKSENCF